MLRYRCELGGEGVGNKYGRFGAYKWIVFKAMRWSLSSISHLPRQLVTNVANVSSRCQKTSLRRRANERQLCGCLWQRRRETFLDAARPSLFGQSVGASFLLPTIYIRIFRLFKRPSRNTISTTSQHLSLLLLGRSWRRSLILIMPKTW